MVVKTVTTRSCDVGGEPDAEPYEIVVEGQKWMVDLCVKHAAPLREIACAGRPARPQLRAVNSNPLDNRWRNVEKVAQ